MVSEKIKLLVGKIYWYDDYLDCFSSQVFSFEEKIFIFESFIDEEQYDGSAIDSMIGQAICDKEWKKLCDHILLFCKSSIKMIKNFDKIIDGLSYYDPEEKDRLKYLEDKTLEFKKFYKDYLDGENEKLKNGSLDHEDSNKIKIVVKSDKAYFDTVDPDTGLKYDIPNLAPTDPDYYQRYVHYMKIREFNPRTFEKILNWE